MSFGRTDKMIPEQAGKVEYRRATLTNQLLLLANLGTTDVRTISIESKVDIIDGIVDTILTACGTIDGVVDAIQSLIGAVGDIETVSSLFGKLSLLTQHTHSAINCYPLLANPVPVAKAAGAWAAMGVPTEIVPVNTIAAPFDIHAVQVSGISAVGDYVLNLYKGVNPSEILIASIPFSRSAAASQEGAVPCLTALQVANARISAALSSGNAAADTVSIKLQYHTYA